MSTQIKPEKTFTEVLSCGHCSNRAPMEICATHTVRGIWAEESEVNPQFYDFTTYELLICPACEKVTVRVHYYIEDMGADEEYHIILYPKEDSVPQGLPAVIQRAYEAAQKVKTIDANAYGVLIGRVLEKICEDRQASGNSLHQKLTDLSIKGEIPGKLVGIADSLRNLRNVGAHAGLGDLTDEEVPILTSLCKAILEYIYTAPHLVKQAEERLDKLKKSAKP